MTRRPGQTKRKKGRCFKKENIWPLEEKKNGEGKGEKYLEKENIWSQRRRGTEKENEVMAEKYTNAQTDFPLVDSNPSTEGVE